MCSPNHHSPSALAAAFAIIQKETTKDFWCVQLPDGRWGVKKAHSSDYRAIFNTQKDAFDTTIVYAKETGGEAYLQNKEGKIRIRNTYGHDPRNIFG